MRKLILAVIAFTLTVSVSQAQTGIASWYGYESCSNSKCLTASGARFNEGAMTAAHKTLPLGTKVKVTRLDSGKSVTVCINDRGPYAGGRIIDLAKRPASILGITESGTAKVEVDVVGKC